MTQAWVLPPWFRGQVADVAESIAASLVQASSKRRATQSWKCGVLGVRLGSLVYTVRLRWGSTANASGCVEILSGQSSLRSKRLVGGYRCGVELPSQSSRDVEWGTARWDSSR